MTGLHAARYVFLMLLLAFAFGAVLMAWRKN
jgi:hypothetical protein